jgi:hydroxypyruvate reductase
MWDQVPHSIQIRLSVEQAFTNTCPDPINVIIASNRDLLQAASHAAAGLGFHTEIEETPLQGEARSVGERIAIDARDRQEPWQKPCARIYGGETTVQVRGSGRGGRNQELALAAALALDGCSGITLVSFASDGVDGPTDAAGAVVDGQTCNRIRASGMDPQAALRQNNSYQALEAAGALIRCGPSGTNLNDVVVVLSYGSKPV